MSVFQMFPVFEGLVFGSPLSRDLSGGSKYSDHGFNTGPKTSEHWKKGLLIHIMAVCVQDNLYNLSCVQYSKSRFQCTKMIFTDCEF